VQGSKEVEGARTRSGILLKRLYNEGDFVREAAPSFNRPVPTDRPRPGERADGAGARAPGTDAARSRAAQGARRREAISQKEFDDAISAQKLSDATLQSAEANLRQAELNLSYTKVTARSRESRAHRKVRGHLVTAGRKAVCSRQ